MPKVSVCVPVYKVEKYIEKCARSLFEQTLDDIEYVFVNDCTPDKSMEVLQRVLMEYPLREKQTKIINHEVNKGSASARNTCLSVATGEYIGWCDSDDWVEPDMFIEMYRKAKEEEGGENADVVWCNYDTTKDPILYSPTTEIFLQSADYLKLLCLGKYPGFVWRQLVKRELYNANNIRFPDNYNMMEDVVVTFQVMYFAKKIINVPRTLYHYVQSGYSITSSPNAREMIANISMVSNYFTGWYARNADMMKYLYWNQQRCKLEMALCKQISISEFNSLWTNSSNRKLLLSNPTIRWYNKIVYYDFSCGRSTFFTIKQMLKKIKNKI